jgi:FkbM family methyltransferase
MKQVIGIFFQEAAEFIYTVLLKPPFLRRVFNSIIRVITPKAVSYDGALVYLNPNDPVVSGALAFRVYEKREMAFLRRHCVSDTFFIDVGANVGLYTALSSHLVGENGRIFAFEPDPSTFRYLEKTIQANYPERICATRAALADEAGKLTLYVSPENRGDNRLYRPKDNPNVIPIDVDVLCFDEWAQEHIPNLDTHQVFIKIDVQGFEGRVLSGMRESLRAVKQLILMMEFWPQGMRDAGGDPLAVLEFLTTMGLTIYELDGNLDALSKIVDYAKLIERFKGRHYTNLVAFKGQC